MLFKMCLFNDSFFMAATAFIFNGKDCVVGKTETEREREKKKSEIQSVGGKGL